MSAIKYIILGKKDEFILEKINKITFNQRGAIPYLHPLAQPYS